MKVIYPSMPMRYDRVTDQVVPTMDINGAANFGTLTPLMSHNKYVGLGPQERVDAVFEGLEEVCCDPDDYLLVIGDFLLVAAAAAWISDRFGSVKVLRWDKRRKEYDVVEVML